MRFGFFPAKVEFRGSFRFANVDQLERALAAIQELIDGEDDDLASELMLRKKDCELRVRVDTTCARDEYLAYETLIETLGSFAIDGEVTGEIDDTITSYCAAGAAGEKPRGASAPIEHDESALGAIAKSMIWIPVIASETLQLASDLAVLA